MKLVSWNVNGIRAVAKKGLVDILKELDADVICFQETKAQDDQVLEALEGVEGYHIYSNSAEKKGYSGTSILSKEEPLSVNYGLGIEKHDKEGRLITAEYEDFYLLTAYVPNSQRGLARLDDRQDWDKELLAYMQKLEAKKPVILCGDMNVAHQPIDLKNPTANFNKTAGYTEWEIAGMDNFLQGGYTDSFRHFYPNEIKYSWWSYRMNARARDIGWRLDYFLVSDNYMDHVEDAFILNDVMGSDHCPVGITLK
ncbi:exodeoxyribonuclease III [Parvicella tangerina]|uniref:Exodeoxyribonuclease n=1 Tax=Parvicella tangerina TaxID=2829795 RepID=A0A916NB24_9FLAO|nr:exodeoxyribonuclease III [Parvicella tangerina]CAG5080243.1 Exodeoxyribonuclease [Parvicella tangerina]